MYDLKTIVGLVILGGMALVLITMFLVLSIHKHNHPKSICLKSKTRDDKIIDRLEERMMREAVKTGNASYYGRNLHIRIRIVRKL